MPEATWEREKCKLDKDVIPQRGGMSSPSQIPPKTCPLRKEDAVVRMVQYDEFLTSELKAYDDE